MKTFEMVLKGHPDKVCDIIAENIKKYMIKENGIIVKTAIEVAWFNDTIIVGGETSGKISQDTIESIVKKTLYKLGYFLKNKDIKILNFLNSQSQEIQNAVEDGAGDNGIFIVGYHRKWSPIIEKLKTLANVLSRAATTYSYKTDGKFIATIDDDLNLVEFTLNIASYETRDEEGFKNYVKAILGLIFNEVGTININPKGDWALCGGFADSGLTGRKLACDNTFGLYRQGGGAFFGKDVSKADYTVPLFLYIRAKELVEMNDLEEIELYAHTIIGDDTVVIYDQNGKQVQKVLFSVLKELAAKKPMNWYGLK